MTAFQAFRNTLVVLLTIALAYLLLASYRVLIGLLVAILIASALRAPITWLINRRIPKGAAIAIVYGAVALLILLLVILVLPPIINQFAGFLENDDRLAGRIIAAREYIEQIGTQVSGNPVEVGVGNEQIRDSVTSAVVNLRRTIPRLLNDAGGFLGELLLMVVMGIYWAGSRDRGLNFIMGLVPIGQRPHVQEIAEEIELGLGAYLRGIVLVSIIVGVLSFIVLVLLRVPNAATISLFYAVATAIPIIGGLVGVGLGTALALLSSPANALAVLVVTTLLQQIENYYLTPRFISRSVDFDPILVIVFVSIGFALNGVIGGLLSIPVAGTVAIILKHMVFEPRRERVAPTIVQGGILLEAKEIKEDGSSSPGIEIAGR